MLKPIRNIASTLAAVFVSRFFIRLARDANQIHLGVDEIIFIAGRIKRKVPCRLLVFGFGYDSYFWHQLNRGGETIFIEDDSSWFNRVKQEQPHLSGCLVDYGTRRAQWQEFLVAPDRLAMRFPDEVEAAPFDCILVDGPHGWVDTDPGRMKSIFAAARLIGAGGEVFVHDCDRIVEKTYCDRFFGSGVLETDLGKLRHYRFP